ncbi:Asp-tRNA(Asn)/Glu-tRNA(Gln) amidotransferase subunit GatC [Chlamydiifrater phoenicopteri]|uniref:Asp-tRNA(Asn)/Glu-tRNA(Gln) amidotransferase subunit GatC n=1 Tax=Chlamydiifrater phoenicopteri TaxID=2681469 RepID=UPI001BCFB2D7|nr:aspartyl/glutamyl-tRNA amidotransferase subunit C [Chlamydiifrater phoenicopteri]
MSNKTLSEQDIRDIAKGASLHLKDEDIGNFVESLNKVVALMEDALQVDTSDIAGFIGGVSVGPEDLREDIVKDENFGEGFFENVPENVGSLVKVPSILK